MGEMLPLILSIGLFVITLVIMFTLRSSDNRSRRVDIIKRTATQYIAEAKRFEDTLQQQIAETNTSIALSKEELHSLLEQISLQRQHIVEHSSDLHTLEQTFNHYKEVLISLRSLTEQAETKVQYVQQQVQNLDNTKKTIDSFVEKNTLIEKQIEHLGTQLERSVTVHQHHVQQHIDESIAETQKEIDDLFNQSVSKTDIVFKTMLHTIHSFLDELQQKTTTLQQTVDLLHDSSRLSYGELESHLLVAQKKLADSESRLTSLQQEQQKIQTELDSLTVTKVEFEQSLEIKSKELELQTAALEQLQSTRDQAQSELNEILEEREKQKVYEEEQQLLLELQEALRDESDLYDQEQELEEALDEIQQELFEPELRRHYMYDEIVTPEGESEMFEQEDDHFSWDDMIGDSIVVGEIREEDEGETQQESEESEEKAEEDEPPSMSATSPDEQSDDYFTWSEIIEEVAEEPLKDQSASSVELEELLEEEQVFDWDDLSDESVEESPIFEDQHPVGELDDLFEEDDPFDWDEVIEESSQEVEQEEAFREVDEPQELEDELLEIEEYDDWDEEQELDEMEVEEGELNLPKSQPRIESDLYDREDDEEEISLDDD